MHGQGPAFNCLFHHAADLNKVDDSGNTAVDMARKNGHPVLISKASK
jgi:ankyrin repeat protein